MGSQLAPFFSADTFNDLFSAYFEKMFELAHSHGAKTMLHSCGSVSSFIPRLIEIGLDILDVVQTSALGMEIEKLAKEFGKDINFCGTMDVQQILINMSPQQIKEEVKKRQELFPDGGLILGPSHAIQPGTPMENIIAMYEAAGSLS
jgi:uroporphyrinogen decarboxylase